jgi:hypothetical protein
MKKYFVLPLLLACMMLHSQVATTYTYSETTGTYTAISGGTQLVTTTAGATAYDTDGNSITLAAGNRFTFNGTVITSIDMTADGALWLNPGTATLGDGVTGSISSTGTAAGIICPLNMDLRSTSLASQVYERRWQDDGTEDIFQWQNAARYLSDATERFSFQVRINKSTGVVRFVYGNMTTISTSITYQPYVGLRGSVNTDYNNRRLTTAVPDASPNWGAPNGTTAGTSNAHTCRFTSTATCVPTSGLIFVWTPSPNITTSVSTLTAYTSCSGSVSTSQSFTVSGTNMTAGISILPPTGFEVSTSATFASNVGTSSVALVVGAAGTISSTTIYARLTNAATGSPSGNITFTSTGATTKNISVSGTVGTSLSAVSVTSSTAQSICLGSGGTLVTAAETGGGTITARQWGKRTISGGTITNVTGTAASYTPSSADFSVAGTYYLVCTSTPTCGSATVSNEVTITVNTLPTNPGTPTSNSPQCASPGVTLTANSSAPAGETWYWQTTSTGTATVSSTSTYTATTAGTYYIRSKNTTSGCWSSGAGSLAITISPTPTAPTTPSPTTASTGQSTTPTLTWAAVSGATSYDVYFGTTLPGTVTANVSTNSYTPSTLTGSTTYSWKVVAKNACGAGTASSTFTFTTLVANDACSNATSLPCATTSLAGTTVGTTSETVPNSYVVGYTSGLTISGYGVWYKFTGDGNSTTVSALSSAMDLELDIYSGTCGSFTFVVAQDAYSSGTAETYTFTSILNTSYYVYIAYFSSVGTASNTGAFTISRTCNIPPTNDACANAISITAPYTSATVNTTYATTDVPTVTTTCTYQGYNVWYTLTGNSHTQMVTTCDAITDYDTEISVYTGSCASLNTMTQVTCNDDSTLCGASSTKSAAKWNAASGTVYYISISGYTFSGGGKGNMRIALTDLGTYALPIELVSFEGELVDNQVQLKWTTLTEINNDYFTLERSEDAVNFNTLSTVVGNGSTINRHNYTYIDISPIEGVSYYRLKQTDYDGTTKTFNIISMYVSSAKAKTVEKLVDLWGREISDFTHFNGVYLIIYSDGSIEKGVKN